MRNRLYDLFIVDRVSRAKMYLWTWIVSFAFGVLLMLSGTTTEQSVVGCSVLALAILSSWTFVYCATPHRVSPLPKEPFVGRRFAIASISLTFAGAFGVSSRRLEASIINRRLLKLTRNGTLSAPEAEQIADSLN